jgi:hypothetical protein
MAPEMTIKREEARIGKTAEPGICKFPKGYSIDFTKITMPKTSKTNPLIRSRLFIGFYLPSPKAGFQKLPSTPNSPSWAGLNKRRSSENSPPKIGFWPLHFIP